jgi:DNA-binding NarL/FixJ family response regulator
MANRNLERSEKYRNFNHDVVISSTTNNDVCIENYKTQRTIHTTIIPDVSMVKIVNGTFILSKESVEETDSEIIPPIKPLPNFIYFNDDHSETVTCTKLISDAFQATYTCPSNWTELAIELEKGSIHLVFHVDMITRMKMSIEDFLQAVHTINSFKNKEKLHVFALIRKTTKYSVIKQLKKLGINGIGLDLKDWSLEQTIESAQAMLQKEDHWPKHIIDQLPGKEPAATKKKQQIQLTERQQDVAKLISQRGCSNKAIGKLLSISESTVKIHVSAILKAYGVRNRTQLALALDGKF